MITSAIAVVAFTVMLGILYPLVVTGVGQVAFPGNANGQQVKVDGTDLLVLREEDIVAVVHQ